MKKVIAFLIMLPALLLITEGVEKSMGIDNTIAKIVIAATAITANSMGLQYLMEDSD